MTFTCCKFLHLPITVWLIIQWTASPLYFRGTGSLYWCGILFVVTARIALRKENNYKVTVTHQGPSNCGLRHPPTWAEWLQICWLYIIGPLKVQKPLDFSLAEFGIIKSSTLLLPGWCLGHEIPVSAIGMDWHECHACLCYGSWRCLCKIHKRVVLWWPS